MDRERRPAEGRLPAGPPSEPFPKRRTERPDTAPVAQVLDASTTPLAAARWHVLRGGIAGVALCVAAGGCITVTTVSIGAKTSLEKQLMGEFEPLTDEEMLLSSVRAGPTTGGVDASGRQESALAARRRQVFNRDDIVALKARGCLGEAQAVKLVARPCAGGDDATTARLLARLVQEENADREVIISWVHAADPASRNRDEVVLVYGDMLRAQAHPGDWQQQTDGAWTQR